MLYVGLDLSRKRLDYHAARADGELVAAGGAPPDVDACAISFVASPTRRGSR